MSKATCTKFKFFLPDQDVEHEQWLRAMVRIVARLLRMQREQSEPPVC